MSSSNIVIVGTGLAGAEAAFMLRECGFSDRIVMIGREPWMPYERPPLSKAYLKGVLPRERVWLHPENRYTDENIEVRRSTCVRLIEREERRIVLADGETLEYDKLILATGGEARCFPPTGAELHGVMTLKTLDDADRLAAMLETRPKVVVIGGGYVGLEFAATARHANCDVTVVEDQPNILSRSLSPLIAAYVHSEHLRAGVKILTGTRVAQIVGKGKVSSVELVGAERLDADLVLVGIGNVPSDTLARDAGLETSERGGILVDHEGKTSDPNVYAIGDCASRLYAGFSMPLRLESVQAAYAQAKRAAASITGQPQKSEEVPWFWSDQFDIKLQMAGLPLPGDQTLMRGDPESGKFSVIYHNSTSLTAIQCVNSPGDFVSAKKMIAANRCFPAELLANTDLPMREIARTA
jgi:3-phenylpropionate/trans-cinnamate dioxygenase ferredoxin reductase subunit